jgi:hypothetical protein
VLMGWPQDGGLEGPIRLERPPVKSESAMAARRRKNSRTVWAVPMMIRRLVAHLVGPGRVLALAMVVVGAIGGVWFLVWQKVGAEVLASDPYQVTAESFDITPLPEWIGSDPRKQVFDSLALGGPVSIMDDNAVRRVADAFKVHPWVDRVISVTKHHPSRIRVELTYRRPVCMVQMASDPTKALKVDARGVWLPRNDREVLEPRQYPLVVNVDSQPVGGLGMPWGDQRVVEAAAIAAAFGDSWRELDLDRIMPVGDVATGSRVEYVYELFTHRGTRILWGRPPGAKAAGEAPAEEKIARLREYAAAHGGLEGGQGGQLIDVRPAGGLQALDAVTSARSGSGQ